MGLLQVAHLTTSSSKTSDERTGQMNFKKHFLSFAAAIGMIMPMAAGAQSGSTGLPSMNFAGPLRPMSATTDLDDAALSSAISASVHDGQVNTDPLEAYADSHPSSPWLPSLYANLGDSYLHAGRYTKALGAWERSWKAGHQSADITTKRIVDGAQSDRALLLAMLGRFDEVRAILDLLKNRHVDGASTETMEEASHLYALSIKDPRHLYVCGAAALRAMMQAEKRATLPVVESMRVSSDGMSLDDITKLASNLGEHLTPVHRRQGQAIPKMSIVHWKDGHYAAIVGERNGLYHVMDTIFPGDGIWMTQSAIDEESSGYFLVPATTAKTWAAVTSLDRKNIRGRGPSSGYMPGEAGDQPAVSSKEAGCPLCGYNINESSVSLTISDTPVGYVPPVGPAVQSVVSYDQRDSGQPAFFTYTNLGQKWTLNWVRYVTDYPGRPGNTVTHYATGKTHSYSGYDSTTGRFNPQFEDGAVLVRVSEGVYRRQLADGSREIYSQSDGATTYPRKVFLTEVDDPQGNAIHLSYTGLRISRITDANGRDTVFSYNYNSQLQAITDPYGRQARFEYDGEKLKSITDIIGLNSSFAYDGNALINSLATPYGTTRFNFSPPGGSSIARYLDIEDPRGAHERFESIEPAPGVPNTDPTPPSGVPVYNNYLAYRNTFHWDKDAYVKAGCSLAGGCDYTLAKQTHYNHYSSYKSTVIESIKMPLENRVWFSYQGQSSPGGTPNPIDSGLFQSPSKAARVLDDGTTQITQAAYDNPFYMMTSATDAAGRIAKYSYINDIDLATISRTVAGGASATLGQFTYNGQHLPLTATDAAGQTTSYEYNAAGQVTKITDALGHGTIYHYDGSGRLTDIVNANNATASSFTYDSLDRIATATDSEGLTVRYTYDAANRIISKSYPDGTRDHYSYDKLDLATYRNRQGQVWKYEHDATRNLTAIVSPASERTEFGYSGQGHLLTLTDARGQVTSWTYDIQGRPTSKTYQNGEAISFAYDATGRIKSQTDALGQVKQFAYTKDDQVSSISYINPVNPTPGVSFTYDEYYSRMNSMIDGFGTTQYQYGVVGSIGALQVTLETGPNPAISYVFDALGRTTSRTVGSADPEIFDYDAIGRMSLHGSSLGTFTYAYLGQTGQLTSRTLAGSTLTTTWTYQQNIRDRRLASISNVGLNAGQHTDFTYDIDSAGMITGITQSSDAAITYPSPTTQSAGYNSLNQLTMLDAQSLTYDVNGNLISDGSRTYSWDADNRLIGVTYPNSPDQTTTFTYDGLGRQLSMTTTPAGGGTPTIQRYAWCGSNPCGTVGATGTILKQYLHEGEKTDTNTVYYGIDQIGSVRRAFTTSSSPAYDYDPYGQLIGGGTPITDYVYAGLRTGPANDIYLSNTRPYSPRAGRWLQRDILGEGTDPSGNLYAYTGGNSIGLADPDGTNPILVGATIGAVVYGGLDLYHQYQAGTLTLCKFQTGQFLSQVTRGALEGALIGLTPYGATSVLIKPPVLERAALLAPEAEVSGLANEIGILRAADRGKGNFGVGEATAEASEQLGRAWVGKGYTVASDGKTLVSENGLRQFRPSSFKPRLGRSQSNFEQRLRSEGKWQSNGHLDIIQ